MITYVVVVIVKEALRLRTNQCCDTTLILQLHADSDKGVQMGLQAALLGKTGRMGKSCPSIISPDLDPPA